MLAENFLSKHIVLQLQVWVLQVRLELVVSTKILEWRYELTSLTLFRQSFDPDAVVLDAMESANFLGVLA